MYYNNLNVSHITDMKLIEYINNNIYSIYM